MDIGKASDLLSRVLSKYNLKNLDDIFESDTLTTTEFMARQIHSDLVELLMKDMVVIGDSTCGAADAGDGDGDGDVGFDDNDNQLELKNNFQGRIRVKLWESHKAWASYEADI
jgi:hypothetical protein